MTTKTIASKTVIATLTFGIVCALSAFLGWCGGFNFARRGEDVAEWAWYTLVFAVVVSAWPFVIKIEETKE